LNDERDARLEDAAASLGIWSRYTDGLGRSVVVDPQVIARLLDALGPDGSTARRRTFVLHRGRTHVTPFDLGQVSAVWEIWIDGRSAAIANVEADALTVPGDLPIGIHRLRPRDSNEPSAGVSEALLIVAPERTYQGPADQALRTWLIAVQLYGLRSRRNWGHGDFTDLATLLDCAAHCGAAGIGLNPLHVLFDDRPAHISPYSPNSRQFIEPLYIDAERIAEFPGIAALNLQTEIERLRACELVDYPGVRAAKHKALRACHEAFRAAADSARRRDFEDFRAERGPALRRFACFEVLRRRFKDPWWRWPAEWQSPRHFDLASLFAVSHDEIEYREYIQWIADRQLAECRARARQLKLPIGLYVDLAVGVVPDGADAWMDQSAMLRNLTIGAPPDAISVQGQSWGITAFSPTGLATQQFEPLRRLLSAVMRHAGAIRIDHVLGLNRLFVIPDGMSAKDGTYLDFPLEAMLALVAEQSRKHCCIVIGEDLGTIPADFRQRVEKWGLWSYRVMQFERDWSGQFLPPQSYEENALVTFATHDLATFAGWWSGHDLKVRHEIGHDSGETWDQREASRAALGRALSCEAPYADGEFAAVARFLAGTPSRIVAISLEDIFGSVDQPNIPGSIDEYPNWRTRSLLTIEELLSHPRLTEIAAAMRAAGRRSP
jgi:4-alpha-glucanotransferase